MWFLPGVVAAQGRVFRVTVVGRVEVLPQMTGSVFRERTIGLTGLLLVRAGVLFFG